MHPSTHRRDDLFRLLVESVRDYAIFLLDPSGYIQSWNAGAERIKGYRADEIIGKHFSIFYLPSDIRRGKPEYELRVAMDEGRYEEEGWRLRKDSSRFWANVVITALFASDGELVGFAKVTRDLTERKQAEDDRDQLMALERGARESTERALNQLRAIQTITDTALAHLALDDLLHALLDRISEVLEVDTVAILLLTDDGQWVVPRAAKGIEEEVEAHIHLPIGRGFAGRIVAERHPIVLDDVEHSDVLNPILRQKGIRSLMGVPLIVEGRALGALHVGSLHPRHFTDDELGVLQVLADRAALAIDHARLYEAATRARADAEAAGVEVRLRDEFLSVAAHELRTPITGLRTAAQVLLRQLARGEPVPPDRLARMATVMDQESEKLSRLVSQLLDLSRLEAGKLALERSEVDLVPLVRGVVERTQAHAPGHELRLEGEASLCLSVDPLRIEQILVNLVDNAVKYSPQGGEVTVTCARPHPGVAEIAVRDHGIGLSAADLDRIFERFYQVDTNERATGLGLGLYVSREIAERHGGRLWAESPRDGGARFVLELPTLPPLSSTEAPSAQA